MNSGWASPVGRARCSQVLDKQAVISTSTSGLTPGSSSDFVTFLRRSSPVSAGEARETLDGLRGLGFWLIGPNRFPEIIQRLQILGRQLIWLVELRWRR